MPGSRTSGPGPPPMNGAKAANATEPVPQTSPVRRFNGRLNGRPNGRPNGQHDEWPSEKPKRLLSDSEDEKLPRAQCANERMLLRRGGPAAPSPEAAAYLRDAPGPPGAPRGVRVQGRRCAHASSGSGGRGKAQGSPRSEESARSRRRAASTPSSDPPDAVSVSDGSPSFATRKAKRKVATRGGTLVDTTY